MLDYEDMILARQEIMEILEDNPSYIFLDPYKYEDDNWWDEIDPEEFKCLST